MEKNLEKRKKVALSRDEAQILKWFYFKTLLPIVSIIVISSAVLYFGFHSLIQKASFVNYGLAPQNMLENASNFISTYMLIAVGNIVLMLALATIIMYSILRNMVTPLMRISRELKNILESKSKHPITVRESDRLLVPLVTEINKLLKK